MQFKSVVFAGGGCRSIWQVGFWSVAAKPLGLERAVIGSVSAGAAMACMVRARRIEAGIAAFKTRFGRNRRNFYLTHWGSEHPVFPQHRIFREGLLSVLDQTAMQNIAKGPEIRVLLAVPPPQWGPQPATLLGIGSYTLEKHLRKPMHPTWSQKLGFRALVVTAQSAVSSRQLADLILQSSCTPPFLPIFYRNGHPVLDGGLIDNVPVFTVADVPGPMLVLLTRRYPANRLPKIPGRVYLQPTKTPPISRWDYTDPDGLQAAYDLGCSDAEKFLKQMRN